MVNFSLSVLDWLLEKLAMDTWENLRAAKRLSVRFGEETITDILMLELRRRGFRTFRQTPLTLEPKRGTDFECWIGLPGRSWTGFAVQAKKLKYYDDPNRMDAYDTLNHWVKGALLFQIDILKDYAAGREASPRYCLYNHTENVPPDFLNCCFRCFPEEELGCTIASTETIEWAIRTRGGKTFDAIHQSNDVVPWRCLVWCPVVRFALYQRSSASVDDISPLITAETIFHPDLPDGLNRLLEQDEEAVDFEEFGIGADPREIGLSDQVSVGLIVPNRIFILDLSNIVQEQENSPV